jgi:hypothetical protein
VRLEETVRTSFAHMPSMFWHMFCSRVEQEAALSRDWLTRERIEGGQPMAEQATTQHASVLEQWLTREFEQALGGAHIIEQLREDLHKRYADDPAVRRIIDRIAAETHERRKSEACS